MRKNITNKSLVNDAEEIKIRIMIAVIMIQGTFGKEKGSKQNIYMH